MARPEVQVGQRPWGLRPAERRHSSHNPGASRPLPGALPPAQPGRPGSQTVSELVDWHGAGTQQPGDRGTCRAEGSDPPGTCPAGPFRSQASGKCFVQPPEAEIFFKSINYFPFSSDPTFFSAQLHIGDPFTSGKS